MTRCGAAAVAMVLWFGGIGPGAADPPAAPPAPMHGPLVDGAAMFDEAWRVVEDEFLDPELNGVDAAWVRRAFAGRLTRAMPRGEAAAIVNESLALLETSHTRLFTPEAPAYYELAGIFSHLEGMPDATYEGVGMRTRRVGGRVFIEDVYDGGPAAAAGLLRGDEIVSVDGEAYAGTPNFRGKAGQASVVRVRRSRGAGPIDVEAAVEWIDPKASFERSIRAGSRVIESGGVRVLYVPVRSYAHPDYHGLVKQIITADQGGSSPSAALVLDIRGGWGGANASYLDIFNPVTPMMSWRFRDGREGSFRPGWPRPAVMLIDGASRSGKEVLAYAFKKHGVGRLVGERTAGAVVGGSPRLLSDGSLLYVAVMDVWVDGERLEGVGVEPDVAASRPLAYSAGADPQLERAVEAAVDLVELAGEREPRR